MKTADKKWWAKFYIRQTVIYRNLADAYRKQAKHLWTRLNGTRAVCLQCVAHFENQASAAGYNALSLDAAIVSEEKGWEDLGKKEAGEDA